MNEKKWFTERVYGDGLLSEHNFFELCLFLREFS